MEKDEDKEEEKHENRIELKATEDAIDQPRNLLRLSKVMF